MLDKHHNHIDSSKSDLQDWEIYASCVRDAICDQSGLPKWDKNSLRDKKAYCDVMQGKTNEINGVTFKFSCDKESAEKKQQKKSN